MPTPRVVISILNWNGFDDTVECLRSLQAIRYPNVSIVVVDNGSSQPDVSRLRETFGNAIRLIEAGQNLGFAEGNNLVLRQALETGADYVLLLNNDTSVDPNFLDRMVAEAERSPQVGMVGAKIFYHNSPLIWAVGGGRANFWLDDFRMLGNGQSDRPDWSTHQLDFLTGCALLIRMEAIRQVGVFDPRYYLYNEEADLCLRFQHAGWKLAVASEAVVWHKVARSSQYLSPNYVYYMVRNKLLLAHKHLPRWRWWLFIPVLVVKEGFGYMVLATRRRAWGSLFASWAGILDFLRARFGPRVA